MNNFLRILPLVLAICGCASVSMNRSECASGVVTIAPIVPTVSSGVLSVWMRVVVSVGGANRDFYVQYFGNEEQEIFYGSRCDIEYMRGSVVGVVGGEVGRLSGKNYNVVTKIKCDDGDLDGNG